jgi:hypothetical protein
MTLRAEPRGEAYLNTEQARWGELRRGLPQHHAEAFRRFIDTLHVRYFYGDYPRVDVEAEYWRWRDEVNRFIEALTTERPPGLSGNESTSNK